MGLSDDRKWYYTEWRVEKKCVICGKEYMPNTHNQKTCGKECSQILNKQRRDEHIREVEAKKAMGTYENPWHKTYEKPKPRKRQPKPKLSVVEIAVLARKEGMTYGQYVAKYNM